MQVKKHLRILYSTLMFMLCLSIYSYAQPANDLCSGALPITVFPAGTACTVGFTIPFTTDGTTDSGVPQVCSDPGNDQWFTWTATTLSLIFTSLTPGEPGIAIFANCADAAAGTSIDCTNTFGAATLTGWALGDNLIIQIYDFAASVADVAFCLEEEPCAAAVFTNQVDVSNCLADMYTIDVVVTNLGSATSVDITNDINGSTATNVGVGTHTLTGFTSASGTVTVTVADNADPTCSGTQVINIPLSCPPANDECTAAVALTVNPDLNCGVTTAGTTANATASPQADDITGTPDNDVWFSFVATSTSQIVSLLNVTAVVGTSTDMGMGLYDGSGGCNALVLAGDSDPNSTTYTGLTVGTIYYLRVYGWSGTTSAQTTFDVCVGTLPPPPTNDECTAAIGLTVNPTPVCGTTTAGTTAGASASPQIDDVTGTPDNDVWFSFVATNTEHNVDLLNVTAVVGTSTDMGMGLYDGPGGCNALVLVGDSDPNNASFTGLTVGTTYYVRVYGWSSTNTAQTNFDICISTPLPPCTIAPANDLCTTATAVSVDMNSCTSTNNFEINSCGTDSGELPAPSCGDYVSGDIWISATVPASGELSVETTDDGSGPFDTVIEIYSGACGALVSEGCDDDGAVPALFSLLTLTGLTPGNTVYIRIHEFLNDNEGTFNVCVWDPNPVVLVCDNPTQYPGLPVMASSGPGQVIIATSNVAGDYSLLTNIANGETYAFTTSATDFITIRDAASNMVLAQGVSPLNYTAGNNNDLEIHYNLNDSACGTQFISRSTTVECLTCTCPPEYTAANGNQIVGVIEGQADYEADGSIESKQLITSNANIEYDSGSDIELLIGFDVRLGSAFHAFIDGCGGAMFQQDDTTTIEQEEK